MRSVTSRDALIVSRVKQQASCMGQWACSSTGAATSPPLQLQISCAVLLSAAFATCFTLMLPQHWRHVTGFTQCINPRSSNTITTCCVKPACGRAKAHSLLRAAGTPPHHTSKHRITTHPPNATPTWQAPLRRPPSTRPASASPRCCASPSGRPRRR